MRVMILLLLAAQTIGLSQSYGQSVGQSNKSNKARRNTQQKKKVPPAIAPKAPESKADQPSLQCNQNYTGDSTKPVHNWVDGLNAISTARRVSTTLRQVLTEFSEFFICSIRVSSFHKKFRARIP